MARQWQNLVPDETPMQAAGRYINLISTLVMISLARKPAHQEQGNPQQEGSSLSRQTVEDPVPAAHSAAAEIASRACS